MDAIARGAHDLNQTWAFGSSGRIEPPKFSSFRSIGKTAANHESHSVAVQSSSPLSELAAPGEFLHKFDSLGENGVSSKKFRG